MIWTHLYFFDNGQHAGPATKTHVDLQISYENKNMPDVFIPKSTKRKME